MYFGPEENQPRVVWYFGVSFPGFDFCMALNEHLHFDLPSSQPDARGALVCPCFVFIGNRKYYTYMFTYKLVIGLYINIILRDTAHADYLLENINTYMP